MCIFHFPYISRSYEIHLSELDFMSFSHKHVKKTEHNPALNNNHHHLNRNISACCFERFQCLEANANHFNFLIFNHLWFMIQTITVTESSIAMILRYGCHKNKRRLLAVDVMLPKKAPFDT